MVGASVGPYAITPVDHFKYHQIFLSYDTDKDGFLTGQEAVAVFGKRYANKSDICALSSHLTTQPNR